ncbi:MAG TPA: hypothetical protein VFA60_03905 [Terriglobales bacterium]|nr:hypothetical protein [Terriglobales bacterium]
MNRHQLSIAAVLLLALVPAQAQVRRHDPLTAKEVEDLREVAQDPAQRLKLYARYALARMTAIDQVRADSKLATAERAKQLHDLIEDLGTIVDEMDDNVEDYDKRKADLRRPLKDVIEADTALQIKLRALKEAADTTLAKEAPDFRFALENTVESVNQSAQAARETLEAQNVAFAKAKADEKAKAKEAKDKRNH